MFLARRHLGETEFIFNFAGQSYCGKLSPEAADVDFELDGIGFKSVGAQFQLIVSDERLIGIFAEILNRKIYSLPVFQSNGSLVSLYIEPITTILRQLKGRASNGSRDLVLIPAILEALVKHLAYVWPNTNTLELSIFESKRPPLALRLALDYISSKEGIVKSVEEIAERTNVGVRALEKIFKNHLGIGIKRYCKIITIRRILDQIKSEKENLSKISSQYGISNVSRLRREIDEYKAQSTSELLPWEIYDWQPPRV